MAFFKKMKDGFKGLTKDSKSKGHTLGTRQDENTTFIVEFTGERLGLTLDRSPEDRPVIGGVDSNGEAARSGVKKGDQIVGVEGNAVESFDDVMAIIGALGRPIHISFARGSRTRGTLPSALGPPTSRQQQQRGYVPPPVRPQNGLTEEERRARREAQLKATEARTSKWDKKIQEKKNEKLLKKKEDDRRLAPTDPKDFSEETKKLIEISKAREQEEIARMGYNPYQVQMSSNQQARAAIVGTGPDPSAGPSPPLIQGSSGVESVLNPSPMQTPGEVLSPNPPVDFVEDPEQQQLLDLNRAAESELYAAEIEDSLAILLSQDNEVSVKAIKTIQKMAGNITKNQREEKFRKVRMGNANFDEKVGSVNGGIQVMQAMGFELHTSEEEAYLVYPEEEAVNGAKLSVGLQKLEAALQMLDVS